MFQTLLRQLSTKKLLFKIMLRFPPKEVAWVNHSRYKMPVLYMEHKSWALSVVKWLPISFKLLRLCSHPMSILQKKKKLSRLLRLSVSRYMHHPFSVESIEERGCVILQQLWKAPTLFTMPWIIHIHIWSSFFVSRPIFASVDKLWLPFSNSPNLLTPCVSKRKAMTSKSEDPTRFWLLDNLAYKKLVCLKLRLF